MSGEIFNGRVGVIIEVAPNQFYQYVLKECRGTISIDREMKSSWDVPLRSVMPGATLATMNLTGRLVGQEEAERPTWVPAEPIAEIESTHALEQR